MREVGACAMYLADEVRMVVKLSLYRACMWLQMGA